MTDSSGDRDPVEVLAEDFLARKRRGEKPTLSEYTDQYPDLAADIRELFPALLMMEDLGEQSLSSTGPDIGSTRGQGQRVLRQLGEYRILREVGRGGMGVVYEAEQQSLGRRVALKVLPPHALHDAQRLQRFEREARAAAKLHHTNIVPVFGVGHLDDTHYYVMQFIQGLGLDNVLEELRLLRAGPTPQPAMAAAPQSRPLVGVASESHASPPSHESHARVKRVAHSLVTGCFHDDSAGSASAADGNGKAATATVTEDASDSTVPRLPDGSDLSSVSGDDTRYWRSVARIGVQVAEALEYAHGQGILHRDIKPSNLLMDMKGTVWVTDFGLAKAGDSDDLTHTGDVVGTIRYMAPERFQGRSDARSDVYSLGLTLYELLALRPAFDQRDRAELMQQVLHEEPPRLRHLNRAVPRDLETIIQKAIAKEPEQRYARAADLAADLQRFHEDRPIQARRTSGPERFWRWCRRNPLPAGLAVAVALSLLLGSIASAVLALRAMENAARADTKAADANKEAVRADTEAGLAKERADAEAKARREADDALHETRHTLAISNFRRAVAEYDRNNLTQARERLLDIPPEERGWEWRYLRRQCDGGLFTLHGHTDPVIQVSYSPNGRYLASTSFFAVPQQVKVWDARTGQELYTLEGTKAPSQLVTFSPDGQSLAAPCHDGAVRIWEAATGHPVLSISAAAQPTTSLAFSPDGRRLAAGCNDKSIRVWDVQHGEQLLLLTGHAEVPRDVHFSPDGLHLGSRGHRNREQADQEESRTQIGPSELKVWNLKSSRVVVDLAYAGRAPRAAFSADGKRLTLVDDSRRVMVWDVEAGRRLSDTRLQYSGAKLFVLGLNPDGQLVVTYDGLGHVLVWDAASGRSLFTLSGHTEAVSCFAFSPDGVYLATGSQDNTIRIWDLRSGKESATLRGHMKGIYSVAFSPDGQQLASGSQDWTAKVWDARNQPGNYTIWQHGTNLAFSPDGQRLAVGSDTMSVLDMSSGQSLLSVKRAFSFPSGVAYSGDGKYVAATSASGAVVCDTATGKEVIHLDYPVDELAPLVTTTLNGVPRVRPLSKWVSCVAFSPDGQRLATGSWMGVGGGQTVSEVRIWDLATRQVLFTLRGQDRTQYRSVYCAAFSPDGKTFAFGAGKLVEVYDLTTRASIFTLRGHPFEVQCLAFSPDGRRLASGSYYDHTVILWDARSGKQLWTLRGPRGLGWSVSFSSDSQRLVSVGGYDGSNAFTICDVSTGQELLTFKEVDTTWQAITFSPDGRTLAAGRAYERVIQNGTNEQGPGNVKVWEAPEIAEPVVVNLWSDPARCVAFSADGQRLAIGTLNSYVRIADTRTGQEQAVFVVPAIKPGSSTRTLTSVAFSQDGKRLAGASPGGTLIWDLETRKEIHRLAASALVAFNPDGALLAGVAGAGQVRVWDSATGQELHTFKVTPGALKRLAFSADGARLLTRNVLGEWAAWDFRTGQKLAGELDAATLPADVHLSPNRKLLARLVGDLVFLEEVAAPTTDERDWRRRRTAVDQGWHEHEAGKTDSAWGWKLSRSRNAALWHLDQLLPARPDDLALRLRRGQLLADLGRWTEARAEFVLVTQQTTDKLEALPQRSAVLAWRYRALTQLADDQTDAYRQTCTELLRRYGRPPGETQLRLGLSATPNNVGGLFGLFATLGRDLDQPAWIRVEVARTCLLQPGVVADAEALLPLVRNNDVLRGAALCRAGKHGEAALLLQAVMAKAKASRQQPPVEAFFFLAIAEQAQGRTKEARQAFEGAAQWLDAPATGLGWGSDVIADPWPNHAEATFWYLRLEYQVLRREAAAMLKAQKS